MNKTETEKCFDVVIVGAGLAGLQCAKALSQNSVNILLVDRKSDLTEGIHTTGIFVRKTLEDFEFPPGSLGKAVRKVALYSPKLKKIELASEKDEFRVGKMDLLYKSLLQDCLNSGVEFTNGTRYVSAITGKRSSAGDDHSNGQASQQFSILNLEKGGKPFQVLTKIIVGADGAKSRVAKDLKLDENKAWIVGYEEVYKSSKNLREPMLHCFLDAKLAPGYLAWIADDSEEIHIGVGGYPAVFEPRKALDIFKRKTIGNVFDLGEATMKETRGGRIPVGGVLKTIANSHGLLIGDAAGAVSPLTAGGLDPCLRLSAFAAGVIAESLQKNDPKVLLNYSGKRFRSRFISRLWMRRVIATCTNQTLLELGFKFLAGKPGGKFAKHVFFGRGSFPDVKISGNPVILTANTSQSVPFSADKV